MKQNRPELFKAQGGQVQEERSIDFALRLARELKYRQQLMSHLERLISYLYNYLQKRQLWGEVVESMILLAW